MVDCGIGAGLAVVTETLDTRAVLVRFRPNRYMMADPTKNKRIVTIIEGWYAMRVLFAADSGKRESGMYFV